MYTVSYLYGLILFVGYIVSIRVFLTPCAIKPDYNILDYIANAFGAFVLFVGFVTIADILIALHKRYKRSK